ncbi:uncharacterized protein LOC116160293 [Photinus pyralis]|uniref:uncharacterized protein LOC116160293 n=1 Tax=Photinus pyralis TaxID=7054 RepID=UPI0012674191|nr:uncharacterized protein LOC116160293 [Photinus pyralis]
MFLQPVSSTNIGAYYNSCAATTVKYSNAAARNGSFTSTIRDGCINFRKFTHYCTSVYMKILILMLRYRNNPAQQQPNLPLPVNNGGNNHFHAPLPRGGEDMQLLRDFYKNVSPPSSAAIDQEAAPPPPPSPSDGTSRLHPPRAGEGYPWGV